LQTSHGILCLEIVAATRYSSRDLHGDSDVVHEPSDSSESRASAQVLKFRLRSNGVQHARPPVPPPDDTTEEVIDDLARYEEEDAHIDYRHRTMMNVIAVVIVSLLVVLGVWIADTISTMEKAQDCVMQGRQNCAPIDVPEPSH
jgi:hypothetical protein